MDDNRKLRIGNGIAIVVLVLNWMLYFWNLFGEVSQLVFALCVILFVLFTVMHFALLQKDDTYRLSMSLSELPARVKWLFLLFTGVALCSVLYSLSLTADGPAKMENGLHWIVSHGEKVRQISEAEFIRCTRAERTMVISAFLMINSFTFAYYSKVKAQKNETCGEEL